MNVPEAAAPRSRPRPNPRRVSVAGVAHLSPRMRRVTLEGEELASFAWSGPAAHLKIVFPEPGSDRLPEITPDGPRPATMRTYTPRRFDAAACRLEVDFVLHGHGPASSWAAQAAVGQPLIIMGPGRGYAVDPDAAWYLLAGDEAALPAIETLLEAIPPEIHVSALIEVAAASEIRALPGRADVRWLVRSADVPPNASTLEEALATQVFPPGDGRIYVGCEADAMRRIRSRLVASSGIDRERIVTRGYWKRGELNHPDHDYATD